MICDAALPLILSHHYLASKIVFCYSQNLGCKIYCLNTEIKMQKKKKKKCKLIQQFDILDVLLFHGIF